MQTDTQTICEPSTPDSIWVGSSPLLGSVVLLDNDGAEVRHGDSIGFSYGIPPVGVRAQVEQRGKSLFALTPRHTPAECNLRSLRRYVGEWYLLPNDKDQPTSRERPRRHNRLPKTYE